MTTTKNAQTLKAAYDHSKLPIANTIDEAIGILTDEAFELFETHPECAEAARVILDVLTVEPRNKQLAAQMRDRLAQIAAKSSVKIRAIV